jgi:hypothetical protein
MDVFAAGGFDELHLAGTHNLKNMQLIGLGLLNGR